MAISKDLTGLYILTEFNDLFLVESKEEDGEEYLPFWKCQKITTSGRSDAVAHEDYLRHGRECFDGSLPPNLRGKKKTIQEEDLFS